MMTIDMKTFFLQLLFFLVIAVNKLRADFVFCSFSESSHIKHFRYFLDSCQKLQATFGNIVN